MRVFTLMLRRCQVVKLLLGLASVAYAVRIVLGITDTVDLYGITPGGLLEFVLVAIFTSVALLIWDIRDRQVR